jgi:hypothetical protein
MPATRNAFSPRPYASRHDPNLHSGIVPTVGTRTIDLGIGHNQFVASPSIKGVATNSTVYWDYGSTPGTITFSVYDAGVLSVVSRDVSFTAVVDSSVG